VIVVLAGIVLPLLTQSKWSARGSDDVSRLRQIGQAAELYSAQWERAVRSTFELVESNALDRTLLSGKQDRTDIGWSNVAMKFVLDTLGESRADKALYPRPYRMSYVGVRDVMVDSERLQRAEPGTVGWLVDFGPTAPALSQEDQAQHIMRRKGSYRRLLNDTAVVVRKIYSIRARVPKVGWSQCKNYAWFFGDFSLEQAKSDCEMPPSSLQ
jgi:hypothetical protein